MVEATCTKFSHVLHQFLSFKKTSTVEVANTSSFPPFQIVLNLISTLPGELKKGWEVGARGGKGTVLFFLKGGRQRDELCQVMSYSGIKNEMTFTAQVFIQHHEAV